MDDKKPDYDEADSIRRWSRGDRMDARQGGATSKSSIEGGLFLAIFAMIIAIVSACLAGWAVGEARLSAERADRASATAALAREYVVTSFAETQRIFSEHGLEVPQGPLGHHQPVPGEFYEQWDQYVAENVK